MKADLHTHTFFSDGSMSPEELIDCAAEAGAELIAVTDHDSYEGIERAAARGREKGVRVLPGIEFSTDFRNDTHILGYGIDINSEGIREGVEKTRGYRLRRVPMIYEALRAAGVDISMDDVLEAAGPSPAGRSHFARAIVKNGYAKDISEAFSLYLAPGRPGYVSLPLKPKEAFAIIKDAGGAAVLAHPYSMNLEPNKMEPLLREWKEAGLCGIEAYYNSYAPEQTAFLCRIAGRTGLSVSAGSDFHGSTKPNVHILGYTPGYDISLFPEVFGPDGFLERMGI